MSATPYSLFVNPMAVVSIRLDNVNIDCRELFQVFGHACQQHHRGSLSTHLQLQGSRKHFDF